jgi:serine protease AprX
MRVVVRRRRGPPADHSCPVRFRPASFLPSRAVIALGLGLAITLFAPVWTPNAVVSAQSALPGVASTPVSRPSTSAGNIDSTLQSQMAASPTQLQAIIVELRPPTAPFQPQANQALAQRGLALLKQFGLPVGGLPLINSAAGWANAAGIRGISADPQVAFVYADSLLHVSSSTGWSSPSGHTPLSAAYPPAVHADRVWWQQAAPGSGVTVAVLDSGINPDVDLTQPTNRVLAAVNFAGDKAGMADAGGHGTHVAGIVGGNGAASGGEYAGIAPGVNFVDVRVINRNGNGRISSLIRGIEWCLAHRSQYNIRVINLSLGMQARVPYRANPLDAAVEIAWMRGITVVAAAGNGGAQGTVDAPGDDPYVITVGATDDRGTAGAGDDVLASFSAWGTPPGSTAKPDLVAPGRRIVSLRVPGSYLDTHYPGRVTLARSGATYFRLSGTSMATPVMTGAAALMLQQQPYLKPDRLKAFATGTTQRYGWAAGGPVVPAPQADGNGLLDTWAATYGNRETHDSEVSRPVRQSYRPADTLARALYQVLYGVPLAWKDPNYLGISWTNLAWDNLAWDNLAWDNLAWDNLAWDNLAWDSSGKVD